MTTSTIPYKDLILAGNGYENPRLSVDKVSIGELAQTILDHGLLQPLIVWKTLDPETKATIYVVVDGSRRYRAIGELTSKKHAAPLLAAVPVHMVEAPSATEARITGLTAHVQREELTSFELAKAVTDLVGAGVKQKDMAKKLRKSPTWVSRQLSAYRYASEPVRKAWQAGKLPDDDVQHLASIKVVSDKTGKPTKAPDHEAQDKQLEKILAKRQNGSRNERAEARQIAKGSKGSTKKSSGANGVPAERTLRPSPEVLARYYDVAVKAKQTNMYARGMRDALAFCLGKLGPGEFHEDWATHAKQNGMYTTDKPKLPKAKNPSRAKEIVKAAARRQA